ncbi:MAG: hypothetical protein V1659_01980 [Candidatus Woesearchaeota archaeon]
MKKMLIGILIMAGLLVVLTACNQEQDNNQLIGGDRDEHGCLGPAGYSWDEDIGACIRPWEINDEGKRAAARTGVEYIGKKYSLTLDSIEVLRCAGCYVLTFNDQDFKPITVNLADWKVSTEEIDSFEECVAAGNPIMESYPRRCIADGKSFTEEVDISCENKCGDGKCDEIVCMGTDCPCAESEANCPEDCPQN